MGTEASELSDLQLAIMRVLWKRGEASAAQVRSGLRRDLAITTVSTMLTRLEKRGVVEHRADGRTFVYRPTIAEHDVRRTMLRSMVRNLFAGDPTAVVSHLLSGKDVAPDDVERMRNLIENHRRAKQHD